MANSMLKIIVILSRNYYSMTNTLGLKVRKWELIL